MNENCRLFDQDVLWRIRLLTLGNRQSLCTCAGKRRSLQQLMMKVLVLMLVSMAVLIMGLLGVINSRKDLEFQLSKTVSFENVKNKVSTDVLKEFESYIAEANMRLDQAKKELEGLSTKVKVAQETADGKKTGLNTCNSDLSKLKSEIGALEAKKNKTTTELQQKKDGLKQQINTLKQELQNHSKVCAYIIKNSTEGMKLCGIVPPAKAPQKPEPAKAAQ